MTIRVRYIDNSYEDFENGNSWEFDDFFDILGEDEENDEVLIASINPRQIRSIIDLSQEMKNEK
ncbi:MAG: hypothetical protein AABX54_05665 [Nanoarchaeota archaeon]